jgi:hypothetical protein
MGHHHDSDVALYHTVRYSTIDNAKWLYNHGYKFNDHISEAAFLNKNPINSIKHMEWLFSEGCEFGVLCFDNVAKMGNESQIKWLYEHGLPLTKNTLFLHDWYKKK